MTTYHAIQRTQKRAGFNLESSERFIANAVKRGRSAEMFNAKEREYLQRQEAKKGYQTIVYNSFCFIVSDDGFCVTMFALPAWFEKKRHYVGKQRIRDAKKYVLWYI